LAAQRRGVIRELYYRVANYAIPFFLDVSAPVVVAAADRYNFTTGRYVNYLDLVFSNNGRESEVYSHKVFMNGRTRFNNGFRARLEAIKHGENGRKGNVVAVVFEEHDRADKMTRAFQELKDGDLIGDYLLFVLGTLANGSPVHRDNESVERRAETYAKMVSSKCIDDGWMSDTDLGGVICREPMPQLGERLTDYLGRNGLPVVVNKNLMSGSQSEEDIRAALSGTGLNNEEKSPLIVATSVTRDECGREMGRLRSLYPRKMGKIHLAVEVDPHKAADFTCYDLHGNPVKATVTSGEK
jgi:hypothetical protein